MIVYRAYDAYDMANSDSFFPTLKEAVFSVRANYGIKGPIKLNAEGEWVGKASDDAGHASGMEVYVKRVEIETTREGLCWALANLPHR